MDEDQLKVFLQGILDKKLLPNMQTSHYQQISVFCQEGGSAHIATAVSVINRSYPVHFYFIIIFLDTSSDTVFSFRLNLQQLYILGCEAVGRSVLNNSQLC